MTDFDVLVFELTGLFVEDLRIIVEAQERLRAERFRSAGYCCEAGAIAAPGRCPWHARENCWPPCLTP